MTNVVMKQIIEINVDVSNAKIIGILLQTPQNLVVDKQMCYDGYVRRLSFLMCVVVVLSACGHKKVQVRIPQPGPVSSKDLEGLASYYAEPYHGHRTASGEIFDTYRGMTAAHRTLPFNTFVRVTNKTNGRQVDVRINDRGPFVDGRVIDLSLRAARQIDLVRAGVAPVKLKVLKQGEIARVPAPSSPAGPTFAVQIGAFENQSAAEDLKLKLERKYPNVTVQAFTSEKTVYRVRIGREPDLESAEKLASQLRKENLKPFVVRAN